MSISEFFKHRKKRAVTPENIGQPDPNEPNWLAIVSSDIWRDDIQPFLEVLRDKAIIDLMNAEPDKVQRLQGEASALTKVLEFPQAAVRRENDRLAKLALQEQEEEENIDGRRTGASWLTRRSRTIRANPNVPRYTTRDDD